MASELYCKKSIVRNDENTVARAFPMEKLNSEVDEIVTVSITVFTCRVILC